MSSPAAAQAHPALDVIRNRISANHFDPHARLDADELQDLVDLATRAPSAYNLQNWRFIAVRSDAAKSRLRALAWDQAKVTDAAVTFIVCGQRPDAAVLPARFAPMVAAGHIGDAMVATLQAAAQAQYADGQTARDEAVRSASLGAATLMLAAQARGLSSCPMVGFDAAGVAQAFDLGAHEVPVMLVAVGRGASGNWPQKPRRSVQEVLSLV